MVAYTSAQVMELLDEFCTVDDKYLKLLSLCGALSRKYLLLHEYLFHGFMRRVGTLRRCAQNVYSLYMPDRSDIPSLETRSDLIISLQAFVFNVFGCLDNLAWVWVTHKQMKISPMAVGLRKDVIVASFPAEFQHYLTGLTGWYEVLENYRHALAHRIPLYVPPFTIKPDKEKQYNDLETEKTNALQSGNFAQYHSLDAAQEQLGTFLPIMTHSPVEAKGHIYFHAQVLADWNTVVETSEKFFRLFGD